MALEQYLGREEVSTITNSPEFQELKRLLESEMENAVIEAANSPQAMRTADNLRDMGYSQEDIEKYLPEIIASAAEMSLMSLRRSFMSNTW